MCCSKLHCLHKCPKLQFSNQINLNKKYLKRQKWLIICVIKVINLVYLNICMTCLTYGASPCLSKTENLCWSRLTPTATFMSHQTKRNKKDKFKIKSLAIYVIFFMECTLCNKQHVGKAETSFNIGLNHYRKDVKNPNSVLACRHSQQHSHDFNNHAKYMSWKTSECFQP